jgi:hypothetical protein
MKTWHRNMAQKDDTERWHSWKLLTDDLNRFDIEDYRSQDLDTVL